VQSAGFAATGIVMHRRRRSVVVTSVAALLGLRTSAAAEAVHTHLHEPPHTQHASGGGAIAPDGFYGPMDTDEALRRAFDATSPDGRVVLVATAGGDHVVTALNLILQVRSLAAPYMLNHSPPTG
jgi:threonine dehydrogenase-like Zn-dependent dehydrogenase